MGKRVAILGSTGSIGRSALDVLSRLGPEYGVHTLAARGNWEVLWEQAERFRPAHVVVMEPRAAEALTEKLKPLGIRVGLGTEALREAFADRALDLVLSGIAGAEGLPASLMAVEAGKTLALANKESVVMAGPLLLRRARELGVSILPVDSEHSAIFQALHAGRRKEVRRVYLTASGGPFYNFSLDRLARATPEEALRHPTWSMGDKITLDSATLMNKALEIVEARWLFDLDWSQIEVLVHPQSVVHSMVEFCDGSIIAQMGTPDMRCPIQYALTYPHRAPATGTRLDFKGGLTLTFTPPDFAKFPALRLGYEAAATGGTLGAVLNAANEEAGDLFRKRRIPFLEIAAVVERAMKRHRVVREPTLDDIMDADRWARDEVKALVESPVAVAEA